MNTIEYSTLSKTLTKHIDKTEKKKNGIYFTPPETIKSALQILSPYLSKVNTILEPSCGSCEFVKQLQDINNIQENKFGITGIEYNKTIYDSIKDMASDTLELLNQDFLKYKTDKTYDLIIGNPPYYVMKKNDVNKEYYKYFDGRPNIFIMFILYSLTLLSTNGLLAFVLPKSFLNSLYYDKTRKHIFNNYKIIHIGNCDDDYLETKQETVLVIFQNLSKADYITYNIKDHNSIFVLNNNEFTIFGEPKTIKKLEKLYKDSTTLDNLGFGVHVGTVVWNQHKSILTNDNTKTRLIYSSNIKNNKFVDVDFKNEAKKKFIAKDGLCKPTLVINRGYGVGKYSFEYCLIRGDFEYLIENHLICVQYKKELPVEKQLDYYNKIMESLDKKRTKKFIKLYFGNNAINTTELCKILPIYDI